MDMDENLIGALRNLLGLYEQDKGTLAANSHAVPGVATVYDIASATGSPWLPVLEALHKAATDAGITT